MTGFAQQEKPEPRRRTLCTCFWHRRGPVGWGIDICLRLMCQEPRIICDRKVSVVRCNGSLRRILSLVRARSLTTHQTTQVLRQNDDEADKEVLYSSEQNV